MNLHLTYISVILIRSSSSPYSFVPLTFLYWQRTFLDKFMNESVSRSRCATSVWVLTLYRAQVYCKACVHCVASYKSCFTSESAATASKSTRTSRSARDSLLHTYRYMLLQYTYGILLYFYIVRASEKINEARSSTTRRIVYWCSSASH